ncbi:MAG: Holliday junction branch migration protein RuvA [Anaerolineae bacterium]|nr:Holliday junction branch migration protein RuvA [Anaerolineae bacterium]
MIASISGTLQSRRDDSIVVQVGGVGLEVLIPSSVFNVLGEIGQPVALFTYLVVREDSLRLFGFATEEERGLFDLLLTVQGVGPKLALSILSIFSPEMLANAIHGDDPEVISRVPGVGKKTAQKIVLELKGKLLPETLPPGLAAVSRLDTEVIGALTSLGYSIVEAQAALQSIPRDAPEDIEERVRLALGYFAD